jgi:hypothetical protein
LRGTYSRYAEQLGQLPLSTRVNPIGYAYAYFYFEDANSNLVLDPSELGSLQFAYTYNIDPANPGSLVTPNVNDPDLGPTLTDELTFGIQQGFGPNVALGLTLTYRNIHDIPDSIPLVLDPATGQVRQVTRADYVPDGTVSGTLPNGRTSNPIPVFTLRDDLVFTGGTFYTNGDREQNYKGVIVTLDRRLANHWSARGHVNYNDWKWKIGSGFRAHDDPTDAVTDDLGFSDGNDVFFEGSGGNKGDVLTGSKWSFGLYGLYEVAADRPWGFNVAGSVNGRQGYVSPPYIRRSGGTGSRRVQLAPIDEFRNDDVITFDARIEKSFHFGNTELLLGIDGFNLLNEDYVLQRERNVLSGRANEVNERLSPRVVRVGATLRFR